MAQLQQSFDARNVDPTQTLPALPVGKHPVVIESSEIKANKANDGGYLEFHLTIIDGPSKGMKGSYRLNLYHSNPQTVEIAYKQLSALCHVTGVYQINDSAQLHNIPFIVEVGLQKGEEAKAKGYTQVERVYDRNGNEPGKPQGQPAAAQPAAAPQAGNGGGWGGAPANPANGAQPPAAAAAPAWGGPPAAAPQPAPAPAAAPAWGGAVPAAAPAAAPSGAPPWGQPGR